MVACGCGGWREGYFSETAASRSAMLLSILKRSLRARENDRAIVLIDVSFWIPLRMTAGNLRLRSVAGLPISVKLIVGHID